MLMMLCFSSADAQIWNKVKKAAKRGVERTVENRTQRETEEATNDVIDGVLGKNKKRNNTDENAGDDSNGNASGSLEQEPGLAEEGGNQVGFKRGNSIIFSDSFERDAIGDFPAKWNTSKGGEVKKLSGFSEKWLKVPAGSTINLEMTKPLPANFTIEYDLIIPGELNYRLAAFAIGEKSQRIDYSFASSGSYGFMMYSQNERNYDSWNFGTRKEGQNAWIKKDYKVPLNQKIHVAIEVNNHQRIRSYLNGVKVSDAPRDFKPEFAKAIYFHAPTHGAKETHSSFFYVSNIIIAETGTDERSQVMKDLIEKGSFTTSDIRFSSGSDKIEASSAQILNQIGEAMKTAPSTQFLIIGHTDSDGDESANQKLSQDRANSVKKYLTQNFGIDASKLMCVGKGEAEPVADNSSAAGKAQNRRVEFRKL